ncbi:MAG: hypothetical protein ABIH23_14995 [bacterium]
MKSRMSVTFSSMAVLLAFLLIPVSVTGQSEEELHQAYLNAVEDAKTAEASEISDTLTAIVEENDTLVWKGEPENKQVLMVTWTSWTGYDAMVGKTIKMDKFLHINAKTAMGIYETSRDIWVTAVPELQNFCTLHRLARQDLVLRLEQLLGLPPHNGKTRFVEFWVDPDDLFRPSPDPEISDRQAELEFPETVSEEYIQWFNELKSNSYGEDGYPWTRLGYTYDWGNPNSEVGLSEFVIREGAVVDVHSATITDEYCIWDTPVMDWSVY